MGNCSRILSAAVLALALGCGGGSKKAKTQPSMKGGGAASHDEIVRKPRKAVQAGKLTEAEAKAKLEQLRKQSGEKD